MKQLFERVKEIPLDQIVRDYFSSELKKSGHDFVCRCPIHDENTASFHVYVDKNRWHCYGACGCGGSAIDLLLKAAKATDAVDAAKNLAARYGIEAKENRKPTRNKKALTVAAYAEFCAVPVEYFKEFELANSERGVEMPYKDEAGNVVAIRIRHALEPGKKRDGRFSWRKGDKPILYGLWRLTKERKRLVIVEGESDTHVLAYNDIAALGVPGAGNFRKEFATALLPFSELVLIQEPGNGGVAFIESIKAALKEAKYQGTVRAVSLPEKDPRALCLTCKDKAEFIAAFEKAVSNAAHVDLYPPIPRTRDLIEKLEGIFSRHIFFKEKRYPLLLALWILATYVHRLFSYFGYVHINSPVLRCGKTLLLDIIGQLASDATPRLSNVSEAIMFSMSDSGATMLLDEIESLRIQDREKFGAIMGLLNAGFQAGAKVPRMRKVEDRFQPVLFNAYCPKALAGISKLSDTLADRSFQIVMTRKTADEKVQRFSIRLHGKELEALRAELKLWATERQKVVGELYDAIDAIVSSGDKLNGLDDRFLDIAEPLLAISLFSDCEFSNGQGEITGRFCALLRDMAGAKTEVVEDSSLAVIVKIIEEKMGDEAKVFIPSAELFNAVREELPWIDSHSKLNSQIKKFGLKAGRDTTGNQRGFTITRLWLNETRSRYLSTLPACNVSEASEGIENQHVGGISQASDRILSDT